MTLDTAVAPNASRPADAGDAAAQVRDLYLDLLAKALSCSLWEGGGGYIIGEKGSFLKKTLVKFLAKRNLRLIRPRPSYENTREEGRDWPAEAQTMIGMKRLNNLRSCIEDVIARGVPGDLIETGVWRGGATIFMRGVLKAHGVTDRTVWAADSFEGLPKGDAKRYAEDAGDFHHTLSALAVSLEEVKANFERYNLLDGQVRFLKGWFKDTLPSAPIHSLAVARLDGDMYGSTMDALLNLYPKLSVGGYCIIDDYGCVEGCKKAVHDYRSAHGITEEIRPIDWTGVYWRRER